MSLFSQSDILHPSYSQDWSHTPSRLSYSMYSIACIHDIRAINPPIPQTFQNTLTQSVLAGSGMVILEMSTVRLRRNQSVPVMRDRGDPTEKFANWAEEVAKFPFKRPG